MSEQPEVQRADSRQARCSVSCACECVSYPTREHSSRGPECSADRPAPRQPQPAERSERRASTLCTTHSIRCRQLPIAAHWRVEDHSIAMTNRCAKPGAPSVHLPPSANGAQESSDSLSRRSDAEPPSAERIHSTLDMPAHWSAHAACRRLQAGVLTRSSWQRAAGRSRSPRSSAHPPAAAPTAAPHTCHSTPTPAQSRHITSFIQPCNAAAVQCSWSDRDGRNRLPPPSVCCTRPTATPSPQLPLRQPPPQRLLRTLPAHPRHCHLCLLRDACAAWW